MKPYPRNLIGLLITNCCFISIFSGHVLIAVVWHKLGHRTKHRRAELTKDHSFVQCSAGERITAGHMRRCPQLLQLCLLTSALLLSGAAAKNSRWERVLQAGTAAAAAQAPAAQGPAQALPAQVRADTLELCSTAWSTVDRKAANSSGSTAGDTSTMEWLPTITASCMPAASQRLC